MRKNGFTLIELVIACCIVGILAAVAIPSYLAYTKQSYRVDATRTMSSYAQSLERCYSQAFTYTGCSVVGTTTSPQGYYQVVVTLPTTSSFLITATPVKAPQTNDAACASFTLNSAGTQGATSNAAATTTQTCWGST